ncbi:FAD binding domain-containing protein [Muricoccus pecuniae]|uniref:Carbon-monoxide dehydrogenase medium subunit n=1 Tax=Muricoccus pecuniae TaxID=693023 RepID=A0A840YHB7_9PROT|nr:xanthine dehydrogenase family protein subunit M [Roseomonas pecuniae]MBB5695761.1 carbon-monoxide dehydrogenase medium subunit [Roseomonas pecuniae]
MKAAAFAYLRARNIGEVFAALAEHGSDARVLAGGQSLIAALNLRLSEPRLLVDITGLSELRGIVVTPAGLRIGALTRHVEILRSAEVARHAPLLAQAVPHVAHAAIRNRGTIGGSLALSDPAAEYPAVALACGAVMHLHGPDGRRDVPAEAFFRGLYETALGETELLEAVTFPPPPADARHAFDELSRRHGDYALVGIALRAGLRDGLVRNLRAAFVNGGLRPVLATSAAAAAEGLPPAEAAEAAAAALDRDLDPPGDHHASAAMRLHLARVLTRRAIHSIGSAA